MPALRDMEELVMSRFKYFPDLHLHVCRPEWMRGKLTGVDMQVCRAGDFHVVEWGKIRNTYRRRR